MQTCRRDRLSFSTGHFIQYRQILSKSDLLYHPYMGIKAKVSSAAPRSGYLPTLDGWRAIAIIAVLFHHGALIRIGAFSLTWPYEFGATGVMVFFAISGVLICTRLLQEESKTGSLHLKGFYIRRVLRIQPAAWIFLLTLLILKLGSVVPLSWEGFLSALFLIRNYLPWNTHWSVDWVTLHFWSLSVEEHFYLVLPAFLFFVRRRRATLLFGAALLILLWASIASRFGMLGGQGFHRTDFCLANLLVPAWFAVLLRREQVYRAFEKYLPSSVGLLFAACAFIPVWLGWKHALHGLTDFAPSILVISTMLHPNSLSGRFLEWRPLRFIGRISYGLYIWQELFFTGHFAPDLHPFGVFSRAPMNFVAVFVLATLSYYLVERPCMRLGHRLARPAIEGRPELAAAKLQNVAEASVASS